MAKKCLANDICPLARGYNAIGDWWSLVIVSRMMMQGLRRFGEIQENLGLARNILAARLKKLVEEEIVEKVPASDGSAYQEYVLTSRGRGLYKVVIALREWGEENFPASGRVPCYDLVDDRRGDPIQPIEVRASDGRVLGPNDLRVVTASTNGQRSARTKRRQPS
jgi:DNA-binding HxlR family transcriptional regulator